jgi:CelD/BcsL family acetyltransferase involved in cellulose biosynthesis
VGDEKTSPEICFGLEAERYRKEVNRYNKKKRRKKFKELWRNTISFNLYNRKFDIDLDYVIQKRRKRYEDTLIHN